VGISTNTFRKTPSRERQSELFGTNSSTGEMSLKRIAISASLMTPSTLSDKSECSTYVCRVSERVITVIVCDEKKQSTHLEYRLICDSTRSIRALNGKVAIHVFDELDVLNVATSRSPFFWLLCLVAPLSSEKNNQEKSAWLT